MDKQTVDIRSMSMAIQTVLYEEHLADLTTIDKITEEIKRKTVKFEKHTESILATIEGVNVTYKSTAPHINKSCYNCTFFLMGEDMIHGTCLAKKQPSRYVCGIGTCNEFNSLMSPNVTLSASRSK